MKLRLCVAAAGLLIALGCFAQGLIVQNAPSLSQPTAQLAVVAALKKNLEAKKLKVGDKVTAQVIQDVIMSGKLVIPRKSKLIGHVVDVRALKKNADQSRLALIFDLIQLKQGGNINFHGVIEALGPPVFDPFLEAALSSPSPYGSGENGPANTAMIAATQITNPAYQPDPSQSSGARTLKQQRENSAKTVNSGLEGRGALDVSSHGVLGIHGLYLDMSGSIPTLVSFGKDLQIESGSQIVISLDSFSGSH